MLVEREIQDAQSPPFLFFSHAQSQSSAEPKQDQTLGAASAVSHGAGLSSAKCFQVVFAGAVRCCAAMMLSSPRAQDLGRL